jgi:hypothetical protein
VMQLYVIIITCQINLLIFSAIFIKLRLRKNPIDPLPLIHIGGCQICWFEEQISVFYCFQFWLHTHIWTTLVYMYSSPFDSDLGDFHSFRS